MKVSNLSHLVLFALLVTLPAAQMRCQLSVAEVQRSVAQTRTPNSLARKMELIARPQPMSSTRIPATHVRSNP